MRIELKEKPSKPRIVQGFPGFGFVGTIAMEFLIEHLKAELIGEFFYDELPVTVAIHKGELVRPMAVYYARKENIVLLHTILNVTGFEWKIADKIVEMASQLKAKEVICLEGVAAMEGESKTTKVFSYGVPNFKEVSVLPINESIIVGVTAAMLLKYPHVSCFFAETQSNLPDSKAAAQLVEVLDAYLGLKLDTAPLLKQAADFETKIKTILQQSNKVTQEKQKKEMSYLG